MAAAPPARGAARDRARQRGGRRGAGGDRRGSAGAPGGARRRSWRRCSSSGWARGRAGRGELGMRLDLAWRLLEPEAAVRVLRGALEAAPGDAAALDAVVALAFRFGRDEDAGRRWSASPTRATTTTRARRCGTRRRVPVSARAARSPAEALPLWERVVEARATGETLSVFERAAAKAATRRASSSRGAGWRSWPPTAFRARCCCGSSAARGWRPGICAAPTPTSSARSRPMRRSCRRCARSRGCARRPATGARRRSFSRGRHG